MNKIFKVVWSKTKECYVVVSEVAKNNGGKKKVLASVLAGLAMVGAGAQVQAYSGLGGHDNPAVETLAVGPDTWANQEAAVAVGMHNNANGQPAGKHSVAIGSFSNANGEISIAMGGVTNASGKMSVAVGYRASATDEAAVALGNMVSADKNSTGVGPGATASGTYAFAGGYQSETTGISGVAIGDNAKAKAARAMAIGGHAEATAEQAIAIGSDTGAGNKTTASKKNAIAVGHGATASGLDTAAIGTSATASGQSSVALGNGTQSTNLNTTAIGSNVQSTKTGSIGIGGNVESIGDYSVAIGSASAGKTVKAVDYATAVGGLSNAAERAAALGAGANAAQARSVAIGYKATASTADGVAIGSTSVASTAAGVQGFNPADSRTNKYGGLTSAAQTSTLAAVSIGNGSAQTRQITGLAAGKEDTDAVNVAQLRSVNLKYAADTGNSDFLLTDGTLTVNGDGDLISTSVESTGAIKVTAKKGGNITHTDGKAVKPTTNGIATTDNVVDAINDSYWKATAGGNTDGTPSVGNVKPGTQVTYSAGDNLKVKQTIAANGNQEYKYSLNPVLTGITSIANTTTGPKMTFGGNSINITGGSLDMGNNKITNLATGIDDKDAVNVKQLKDTEIHITPGTYTPDSNKKVTLTYENGDNKTVAGKTAVIDLSGLATGGTASTESVVKKAATTGDTNIADVSVAGGKAVNDPGAQYEVSVSKNAVKDAAREAVTVNNGGNTDNPISVTPTQDNTNHNTTYAVTFDGNKAAKQIPLTYKATNGTITTADQTVKLDKGLNFTGGDYTTASVGADGKVTFDVNLGTAPTVTDGKPGVPGQAGAAGKDGIATVKTVVDTINNSGWKANAKANGGTLVGSSTATVVKPGDQVNFAAGKNLTVKQDLTGEHTYTYSLNKDLKDLTSVEIGGSTIKTDGDHITITSPDTTTGATPGATVTNKVANLGDEKHIKPDTYAVATDGSVTLKYVDGNGKDLTETTKITGITNQNLSNISTAGETKIKNLAKSAINMEDGKNTKASKRDVNGVDTYKVDVEGDLTGISSITNGGTNNGKISFGPNKTVTVDGDHSITLNASTGKIGGLQNLTFDPTNFTSGQAATEDQLKSVHDTLKASELHIAPTESNRTGEHIAGAATSNTAAGAAANAYKYDATTKQVVLEYNDGTGANKTGTKAVIDFSALNTGGTTASTWTAKTSAENTTAGSEVGKHAGDTSQVIGNQNSVDFQAGKNMTVKQTNDGNGNTTINYALDKNLDVESVHVGKDGKDGKIGIDGKDGVDGLDGTNRVDIHVEKGAKGVDGTDGHDGVNGHNGKDGMTRIVYEDKGGKQEVATLNDGMKYAGDDAQGTDKTKVIAKKLNETLDIIGGANKTDLTTDNIGVNNDGNGKLLVQLSKNLKGINTIKNGNTTITLNDTPSTTTPAVTITGGNLSLGDGTTNNKIVNVAPGTDDTDAVNVKQLKDAKTVLADGKNTKKSGTGTAANPYKVNVEGDLTEITSITNKADASGNNAGKITFSPNQTVTVSGDHNISLNGKTGDITGLTNTTIPTTAGSDFATKGRAATEEQLKIVNDKFNNKINLGADGSTETTKLALDNNGGIKFNIKGDGSGASGANQYISTTASGSDIKVDLTDDAKAKLNKSYNVTSNDNSVQVKSTTTNGVTTFDLKVAPAAGTTSTWDIKSSADTANGGATATGHETAAKTIANTNSVEMIAGKNLTVKQTSDTNGAKVEFALSDEITVGKDGTNGVDGKIGVNGKDGASVVINGKDGSIGLTGAPGTPGTPGASATLKVKDGVPGVDGAPGTNLTRIVYTDKNNVEHEVATHDDGMKFAGDDGQANQATNANVIKKHLNNVVDIIGGATKTDLTTNNIGVNNDGNGKLLVQLSKNLNGINTVKNGNTTITLNDAPGGATNTPAVTISGGNLSMGDGTHNNKIVNVAPGTDDSDAVNYKQLKAAKTEVKAGKNVVVTSETSTTDGHTTYTVNASTPAVYTKPDGTKLVKQPDGTFKEENGTVYNGPVIASFEDGTGATTGGNMIVNNVGSAINNHATPGVTSPTYLDKLDAAAGDNNTKNAAVNVTDLKNTKDGLIDKGLKFDANVGGVKTNKLGSTVKVQGAGTSADADYSGANIKTFISQTGDDTTIDVKLDKNLKGINKISNGGSSITLNDTPSATVPAVTITGGNLSMGDGTTNNKIVNLAPGTADTDAVNVKQLKDTELHITPGTYTPDTNKKVTLTYTNGNGTVVSGKEAVIDLSGLSTGGATASTWNVKSSANTTDGGAVGATHDATAQNIANGKTVEFQSGKNLVVNQTNDTTNGNATVEFSLSDNITVGKDGANGKDGSVGAKGADGSAVVMNGKDGSIGLNGTNGANGISIKGKDGANGVGIDGKDGVTRIVYTEKVPDPANPGTTKEVTHEVATMDDGLKFTGNNTATENKHKLGSLVKVQGEGVTAADEAAFQSASGNIAVTADGTDTLTIRLNKNLKGLNSIQLGDNTIKSNGDNIEFTTKGGTTKTVATTDQLWTIQANGTDVPAKSGKVNLVAGDHITITPDAANGKMTISATGFGSMDGFNVKTSAESATVGTHAGDTTENIKNGKTVDMQAGKNLVVTQTNDGNGNTTVNYALNKDVDLGTNGSLKTGDTTVNKDGVTIANGPSITKTGVDAGNKKITNVADGDVNATSKDAVNGSQLKKYTDAAKTTVEAGDNNVKVDTDTTAADGHTNYKVSLKPVVTIGDTHKVKIDGQTGDITGLTNVDLTDPTFATKGRAATEEQLNKVLTEAKKKAVEKVQAGTAAAGDTNIATVAPKAGDTFGAAGATYEVSVSKNAVKDAAKEAVKVTSASPAITVTADTSVAHETTYKVGFDGNQAATQIPLTYKQNGGNTRTVKLSDGLNFIDGTNTKARTAADGKVTFDVMGDLTGITSISNAAGGPKMTFGGNSINVTGGNLDMGGKKITNIGKGTDPTDAARVGQLTKVTSNNHSVVVTKTTDADGAPVYDLAVTGTPGAPAADPRVDMLGEEIGRVGAQGAALSALKPIQYDPLEPTQIMAGYGNYRGNSAVALGVAHYKNESTLIHGGVSWAGGSSHMMANAGVTWKVGNRDSEAAVADRYRKGPISSAYAMQQEMAAMKAQNAGLKGEVSDLKAENEQMKAQIAAMMAKLGL
ncbi:MAG: ESPR-type extended signal peptide-containing protein [Veillonella sp.]|nr:ESPR-type extended signal peptide-containing protein [Veillonella sp.]MDU1416412.1 ESPR-type extended signal peptide-containing protein [Veillonella sp.]